MFKHAMIPPMLRTLNIKAGQPIAEDALTRMCSELAMARKDGVELVRLIHGYGSGGTGGVLYTQCHACLDKLIEGGRILRYVRGEDYAANLNFTRDWMQRYPALRRTLQADSNNPGITFVVLSEKKRKSSKPCFRHTLETALCDALPFHDDPKPCPCCKKGNPPSPRTTPPQKRKTFTKTGKTFGIL